MPKDLNDQLKETMAQLHKQLVDFTVPRFNFHESLAMPMPEIPKFDHNNRYDSARHFINAIHNAVGQWKSDPTNAGEIAICLVMPDGRYMVVEDLDPLGFSGFVAKGYIDGAHSMVTGHVNTLSILCMKLSKAVTVGYNPKLKTTESTETK